MLDNVDKNHKNLQWITWKGAWALSPLQTSAGRDLLRFPGESSSNSMPDAKKNLVHIMVIWLSCERMSVVYMREKKIHIQQGQRQICRRCRNGGYTCTIPNITTGGPKTETLPISRMDFLCISLKCCNILLGSSEKELLQLWENIYETRDLTFSDMVLHYFTWKNNLFERKQWKMVIWKFSRIK